MAWTTLAEHFSTCNESKCGNMDAQIGNTKPVGSCFTNFDLNRSNFFFAHVKDV